MRRHVKEEDGVISIAMAILIPVIIFGTIYVYALLSMPQQENTVHKIVYASSEAYLSRYNAYLFEQIGLLANMDTDSLEPLIMHYLMRNKCIDNREAATMRIDYEKLNTPIIFKEAALESSSVLIGNVVVNYGIDLLNQFDFADKVRTLNQSIQDYEKKLSEQFDKRGATKFLKTIEMCHDVQTGKAELKGLKAYLKTQYKTYFETYETMKTEFALNIASMENPKQILTMYIDEKVAQWKASELTFESDYQDYVEALSLIEEHYERIEKEEETERQLVAQIESENQKKTMDQDKIDQLEAQCVEAHVKVARSYSEIEDIVSELMLVDETDETTLVTVLKNLVLEAEYLFSGIEIGSTELVLEEGFKHSQEDFYEAPYDDPLALPQKIKLNEYYLSIFSSYDVNCPRVIDPQNRHDALRVIKGEAEYLLSGLPKEKQSISLVRLKIYAIRSAANVVTLLSDKDKLAKLSTVTVALPQPWRTLAYSAAIVAWSGVESYSDVNRLMKGESFYFLKTKAQWHLDFDALLDGSWKNQMDVRSNNKELPLIGEQSSIGEQPSIGGQPSIGAQFVDPNLFYMDYLRLLLLMQDEQTTLLRAMDLVEAELLNVSEDKTSLVNFSRGHTIDLTWKPQVIFGFMTKSNSTLHMRNGFQSLYP